MNEHASNAQPDPAATCPTWCAGDHGRMLLPGEPFHHRSALRTVVTAADAADRPTASECVVSVALYETELDDPARQDYRPVIELTSACNDGMPDLSILNAREARELASALQDVADTLTLASKPHPDFCEHDETSNDGQTEEHRGGEVYVNADHPGDPTFVVAAVAHPDAEEARGYTSSTVQLSILGTGCEPDEVETWLYPGTAWRLACALMQARADITADDGAHPLDPS